MLPSALDMGKLGFLSRAYSYAKEFVSEKVLGKTTKSLKENYVRESLYSARAENNNYFERGLEVVSAFRAAKKFGKPEYGEIALSKFEALKKELSKDEAGALATDIWMNVEAYQATGDEKYARVAKEDADVLVDELIGDLRFARAGKKSLVSRAEDQLTAASALLQLYELSKVENYRRKAEDLLDFFSKRHAAGAKGKIYESLKVDVNDGSIRYASDGRQSPEAHIRDLAAVAYMNAHRITGNYAEEAKRFFDNSGKSLLLYSEASRSFKMKEYSKKYNELLKQELVQSANSVQNAAAAINAPAFNVEPADPGLFREMLGVNFAAALGVGFVGTILPFYMSSVAGLGAVSYGVSLAATCLANVATLPYIGRLADRVGKKTVLATGLAAYAASIVLTPWSIANYKEAGLLLSQIARGVSGSAAGPIVSSLVTDAAPASKKTEALSKSATAFSGGYAVGSFSSGFVYEYMKTGSELGKFAPFLAAAVLPAAMSVKLYSSYRRNQLRRKTLDSIFSDTQTVRECEPSVAEQVQVCAV